MIAFETATKFGKSPKKPRVELTEETEDVEEESDEQSEEDSVMDSEGLEVESADEGGDENESEGTDVKSEPEDDGSEANESKRAGNPGWADVMQKILRTKKPKRKKTIVLSKAKKLCDVVKKEKEEEPSFEVDGVKKEVKTEDDDGSTKPVTQLKQRRKDNLGIRIKPSIADRERERTLQKIATKGVVQLFNAVRQQQGEINRKLTEAGPLERKREKVMQSIDKKTFLDVLMGGSKSVPVDNDIKDETEKNGGDVNKKEDNQVWSVLRDDFVMGAKLKDWDRKEDEDEGSSAPEDMDSDD